MNEKTEKIFNLVLGVIKIISGFMVLIGVLFLSNKIVGLEKENAVLEERLAMIENGGYYDAKFVEILMDDVETFTEYLIGYIKLNGTDVGFEEWLLKYDKPLYDRFMYYDDIYEARKK